MAAKDSHTTPTNQPSDGLNAGDPAGADAARQGVTEEEHGTRVRILRRVYFNDTQKMFFAAIAYGVFENIFFVGRHQSTTAVLLLLYLPTLFTGFILGVYSSRQSWSKGFAAVFLSWFAVLLFDSVNAFFAGGIVQFLSLNVPKFIYMLLILPAVSAIGSSLSIFDRQHEARVIFLKKKVEFEKIQVEVRERKRLRLLEEEAQTMAMNSIPTPPPPFTDFGEHETSGA